MDTPVFSSDTPHLCGDCAHFIRRDSDRLGEFSTYRSCRYMAVYAYVSPHFPCRFSPSRYQEAKNHAA